MTKPFQFGVMCAMGESAKAIKERAKKLEDLGYYTMLYNDHYAGPGAAMEAANHGAQGIAPIPAVTLAADATSTLRVGFRVLCQDYHNVVVLAKELASIDLFSEGRLEVGIGAGWIQSEYEGMGIPFDSAGERIARLEDYIEALKALFSGEQVHVVGDHGVNVTGLSGLPLSVQRPHPPIALGGGGRKVLSLGARVADIVAINMNNERGKLTQEGFAASSAAAVHEKISWIRDAAGPRIDDLTIEIGAYFSMVTDDAAGTAQGLSGMLGLSPEDVLEYPHALIGTPEQIVDTCLARREEYGFSYVTISDGIAEMFAPVVAALAGK
jgi:probable F420-dependent oxidoreductase